MTESEFSRELLCGKFLPDKKYIRTKTAVIYSRQVDCPQA